MSVIQDVIASVQEKEPGQPEFHQAVREVLTTLEPVVWSGADDVSAVRGKPVRFRFTLRKGSLYAFWVSVTLTFR